MPSDVESASERSRMESELVALRAESARLRGALEEARTYAYKRALKRGGAHDDLGEIMYAPTRALLKRLDAALATAPEEGSKDARD